MVLFSERVQTFSSLCTFDGKCFSSIHRFTHHKGVHQYRYFPSSMRSPILLLFAHAYMHFARKLRLDLHAYTEMHIMHEHTTKELVYALRTGRTCIGVHPFDVLTCGFGVYKRIRVIRLFFESPANQLIHSST